MAGQSESGNQASDHIASPIHLFTYDEERIEHIITDEQLIQVANGGNDVSLQISIGALGVAVGVFQNLVSTASAIQSGAIVSPWQALGAGLFLVAATTFIVAALYYRRTSSNVANLTKRIRNRKVGRMAERPFVGGEPFAGDPAIPTETSSTTE